MTTLAQEVDAKIMEVFRDSTIDDLEREIANPERMEKQLIISWGTHGRRAQAAALRKHADMLRQELQKRQALVPAVEA